MPLAAITFSHLYETFIVPGSSLLPIIAAVVYYKQLDKPLRALMAYLIVSQLINMGGIWMAMHRMNNLPLLHVYTMVELVMVMLYYRYAFNNRKIDKWTMWIMILYPIFCILNIYYFQKLTQFNTYTRPIEAVIIIIFSGIYFAVDESSKITTAGKWIASAFLVLFCSSLFEFIFANEVSHHATKLQRLIIWNIFDTFVLIEYLMFFAAILIHGRTKR